MPEYDGTETWIEALLRDPKHHQAVVAELRAVAEEVAADPRYADEEPIGPDDAPASASASSRKKQLELAGRRVGDAGRGDEAGDRQRNATQRRMSVCLRQEVGCAHEEEEPGVDREQVPRCSSLTVTTVPTIAPKTGAAASSASHRSAERTEPPCRRMKPPCSCRRRSRVRRRR